MSEENKLTSAEQVAEETAAKAPVEDVKEESKPYKVYGSEDEFKKEVQSLSSKAKFALLQELNVKNLEEARAKFTELEFTKSELKALNDIKAELESAKAEKQQLSENLMMTELGIKNELKEDFLTLAKSKVNDKTPLPDAAKSILEKYTYFKGADVATQVAAKIGTEKKPQSVDMQSEEKERLMKRYPHLKGKI
jgi:DNA primase catalytic subunit